MSRTNHNKLKAVLYNNTAHPVNFYGADFLSADYPGLVRAFVTVPCEIFCHFGLELKRRSPFPITAVFGLTNGDMGYCPTIEGAMGGSWEGTGSLISRWDVQTGYRIVDEWSRMLHGFV